MMVAFGSSIACPFILMYAGCTISAMNTRAIALIPEETVL